jgi:alanine-glyoxylate transaminase/serine-glyoxylate transaminase/serine-pyruvate transaminase
VLVASIGYFGERLAEMAGRHGAQVDRVDRSWGQVLEPEQVEAAMQGKNYKLLAMVHAETSTGAWQPQIPEFASAAHRHGALMVLDTVTSLGGIPVEIDVWDVDVAYSASQKCLSAPSGMAPITVSERAREVLHRRKTAVDTWYLDLAGLEKYWGQPHAYHHTAPISMVYALREALRLVVEEELETRFTRHRANAELLWAGLEEMDLPLLMAHSLRLPTLTTPQLPASLNDADVRRRLLEEFNVEIAGGFGPLKGKVWRIGLMGFSSRRENVALLLEALRLILTAAD